MGGELDSHEEVRHFYGSPGEIKRREVMLDTQVSPEEIKSREVELGLKAGLLLHQLFLNSGATDIVFMTLFTTTVENVCVCGGGGGGGGENSNSKTLF